MTPLQQDLRDRLSTFPIGPDDAPLSFARRLARENGWPVGYAERVVGEYRRFLFLAATAGHPVTPSDEVDQAWHLHLAYTESYWNDLCAGILGRPLHHGPTQGGAAEDSKFRDWYRKTLLAYRAAFGHDAPRDVWPESSVRFRDPAPLRRVDTSEYWMIPRRRLRQGAVALGVLGAAATTGVAADKSGAPGTIVAIAALVLVVGIAVLVVARLASRAGGGGGGRPSDPGAGGGTFVGCGGSGDGGGSGCGSGCSGGSGCGGGGCGGGGCGGS